ncbi:MAG: hypothetical protein U0R64_01265 [Candidatus Nanopelagicales bacterium]
MASAGGTLSDRAAMALGQWRAARDRNRRRREWVRNRHRGGPSFRKALAADTVANLGSRGELLEGPLTPSQLALEVVRLTFTTDAFLAQVLYRSRTAMLRHGIPVLPRVCHTVAMATSGTCIGDPVIIQPGWYLPHGHVVLDGITTIGPRSLIAPFVSIGLVAGDFTGPTIGSDVHVGTGSRILGPRVIGDGARVGSNAVVTKDVAPGQTVVGVPARPLAQVPSVEPGP